MRLPLSQQKFHSRPVHIIEVQTVLYVLLKVSILTNDLVSLYTLMMYFSIVPINYFRPNYNIRIKFQIYPSEEKQNNSAMNNIKH